jgi:hypothetical protein
MENNEKRRRVKKTKLKTMEKERNKLYSRNERYGK